MTMPTTRPVLVDEPPEGEGAGPEEEDDDDEVDDLVPDELGRDPDPDPEPRVVCGAGGAGGGVTILTFLMR